VRYRDPRVPITLTLQGPDSARVIFTTPQRGLAAGQIIAFHEGDRLIGGGIYV
jgi:tRNA-specific 2-thiouridylase